LSASNTKDCVRDLVGKRIVGVLFDALPVNRSDLASGNKTLVFDDGSGFTFNSIGSFWAETAAELERAITQKKSELSALEQDIRDVLALAGEPS
jgi:hypothetical protein